MILFSIAGFSGSGKTTLVERLVREWCARGRKVATVKKVHGEYDLQPPGKDSARFLQAGAAQSAVIGARQWLVERPVPSEGELWSQLRCQWHGVDVVLLEGWLRPGVPALEVVAMDERKPFKYTRQEVMAWVGERAPDGERRFDRDATAAIIAFMEECHGQAS